MRVLLAALVVISLSACASVPPCGPAPVLSGTDCRALTGCDDLNAVLQSFVEAQCRCVFSAGLRERITAGGAPNSPDPLVREWERCLGPIEVISWDIASPHLIEFYLRRLKDPDQRFGMTAMFSEDGCWYLYWPAPTEVEVADR